MGKLTPDLILRRFLAGDLDETGAVRALLQLAPHEYPSLMASGNLTTEQRDRLKHLSQVVGWELRKRQSPTTTPAVPYGSPEHLAFLASIPHITLEDDESR